MGAYSTLIRVCKQCQRDYCYRCSIADDPDEFCAPRCEEMWDGEHPKPWEVEQGED